MKVYVASSWRNEERQQAVVRALRTEGHEVYDFRNPAPGDTGFGWPQVCEKEDLVDPKTFRDKVLEHPIALAGFRKDMGALMAADATVLVLPCGRSAHLELGYATGMGQTTLVLTPEVLDEPELMYLMNSKICVDLHEVIEGLKTQRSTRDERKEYLTDEIEEILDHSVSVAASERIMRLFEAASGTRRILPM